MFREAALALSRRAPKLVLPAKTRLAEVVFSSASPLIPALESVPPLFVPTTDAPEPKLHVPPEMVPPLTVTFWLLEAVVMTARVPLPLTVIGSVFTRLLMVCVPELRVILGTPEMVTSSAAPGKVGLLDQFAGEVHKLSPAPPVHATALISRRGSSDSQAR